MRFDAARYYDARDLLIAAAFDLGGGGRTGTVADRITQALLLGKGGDVRYAHGDGAFLAARSLRPDPSGRPPRVRRAPFHGDEDGSSVLLAGTIHHPVQTYRALRLDAPRSAADLYAAVYARHGEKCDRLIVGDYVAVQWFPGERRVRLARSPTGSQPLHHWRDGDFLVVSSIPRALFAAGAPTDLDPAMLGDRLMLNPADHRRSFYRDHRRLPVGTVEHHDRAGTRRHTYYSLADAKEVRFARDADYVAAVDEQMRRAVEASLEGSRRCAVWLSGGLDSQAVASYAVERLPPGEKLHAFTSVPMAAAKTGEDPTRFSDETEHVHALAAMYEGRIEPTFLPCEDARLGDGLEPWLLLGSWPAVSGAVGGWVHEALRGAAAAGCDVALSAGFGNVGFSYDGETGYPTWLRQGRLVHLLRELRQIDDGHSLAWRFAARAVLPNLPRRLRDVLRHAAHPPEAGPFASWCPATPEFANGSGALKRYRAASFDGVGQRLRSARAWRQFFWEIGFTDGPELQLSVALAHGVQERDPTSYQPLMELCAGIPDDQYLRAGEQRWLARRLLRGRVPEMVRTERRTGRQNADWALRFERERADLRRELAALMSDDMVAGMIDLPRLARDLDAWPGAAATKAADVMRIRGAIGCGVTLARFMRYSQGRNVA